MDQKYWKTSVCTIKADLLTLEIPKTFPSCVFLTWRGEKFQGHSKCYHTAQNMATLDSTFVVQASRSNQECAMVTIQSKTIRGIVHHLGETKINVPTSVFDGISNNKTFEIPTDAGIFKLTMSFFIQPEADLTQPSTFIRDPPNLNHYSYLVKRLKPNFFSPNKPSDFWGPGGLINDLQNLANCRATEMALNDLDNLNQPLHKVAKDLDFYSSFLQRTLILLIDQPLYVNLQGSIVSISDKLNPSSNLISIVAIKISTAICHYLRGKIDTTYLEMPIIDICGSIVHLICDPNTNFSSLIHVIACSLFVISYIISHYKGDLPTVVDAFKVVEKHALIVFLNHLQELIQKKCTIPLQLQIHIQKYEKLFQIAKVPAKIWAEMYNYFVDALDYYAASHWISNSKTMEFDISDYRKAFPNEEFPFMSSIVKICENPEGCLQNRNLLKDLKIKGDWLFQVLLKANEGKEKCLTEAQILKLVRNPEELTLLKDIDNFVQENQVIDETLMEVPWNLPVLPAEYR